MAAIWKVQSTKEINMNRIRRLRIKYFGLPSTWNKSNWIEAQKLVARARQIKKAKFTKQMPPNPKKLKLIKAEMKTSETVNIRKRKYLQVQPPIAAIEDKNKNVPSTSGSAGFGINCPIAMNSINYSSVRLAPIAGPKLNSRPKTSRTVKNSDSSDISTSPAIKARKVQENENHKAKPRKEQAIASIDKSMLVPAVMNQSNGQGNLTLQKTKIATMAEHALSGMAHDIGRIVGKEHKAIQVSNVIAELDLTKATQNNKLESSSKRKDLSPSI